jgi:excisionase family DNA binding protein
MRSRKKHMKSSTKSKRFKSVSTPVSIGASVEKHFRMTEAASVLGVSRATLYRWLPQIAHRRIPAGGLDREIILIPESALNAFLCHYDHKPGATNAA